MTMITPSYLGETIEYSSLHACRSTLEDPTVLGEQCLRQGPTPAQYPRHVLRWGSGPHKPSTLRTYMSSGVSPDMPWPQGGMGGQFGSGTRSAA